jgi:N-acetylglucosaminyl-diphospho-decaprenol L-rhamnosyltransferase
MIDLSIIIVNWNVCGLLCRCLHSILDEAVPRADAPYVWQLGHAGSRMPDGRGLSAAPGLSAFEFEVLVIDSASTDDSVETVRQEFPGVRLYPSETNLGYTGGNNLGMRESRGRYVLVLNPDTEVLGNALGTMVAYMDDHPRVGVVGPQILWPDGSVQPSRRRFPTLRTALVESTFLQKRFPRHPIIRRYYVLDQPDTVVSEVDWVQGACLMVRREVIEQVGVLDDAYFMYSEELDWQRRIAAAGWKVVYLPSAQIVHYEGKSSEQAVALRHIRFSRSKVRYFGKHHGSLAGQIVRGWLLFNYTYEWTVEALKWCLGHRRDLRRERMRAYEQVLRSRLSL